MRSYLILTLLFSILQLQLKAQTAELIGDRPDMTESAYTIAKGHLQIETGFEHTAYHQRYAETSLNSTLIRLGIIDQAELRLGFGLDGRTSVYETYLHLPFYLGSKIHVLSKESSGVEMAVLLSASGDFTDQQISLVPGVIVALEFDLSEQVALGMNAGAEYDGQNQLLSGILSASAGFSLNERTGFFTEGVLLPAREVRDARLNAGITYLFTPKIQADFYGGVGLLEDSPAFVTGAGIILLF
ncbi:transporter [Roseimarinus sediminis]|uniref:transporter n=1 Tax=Roseimarinus sediminis TaxID=1610899 RepID=UPI003D229561